MTQDDSLPAPAGPGQQSVASLPDPPLLSDKRGTFHALRNRNYRLYYFSQMASLSGTWMQTVAQAILVLRLTNSKVQLGTVTLLQFLPITIFVLFAGVIADRVPKRKFIIGTQALAMTQAVILSALVWSGHVQIWHVYLLAMMLGLANAFEQPTRQAFVVELVGKDDVPNAVALNSGMFNAARLIGPGIGGFIIAAFGLKVAFMLNAISFIPIIGALFMLDTSKLYTPEPRRDGARPLRELREGLSYVYHTPAAMLIVIMLIFVGTFGFNFTVMLPLLNRYVVEHKSIFIFSFKEEVSLGFLLVALGFGSVISALSIASRGAATRSMIFGGGACFAVLLVAVSLSHWLVLTIALLTCTGIASTVFQATANTSMQLTAPDHLRGRVMSLYMLLFAGSTPFGGFITGVLAKYLGTSAAVAICGGLCGFGIVLGLIYYASRRDKIPEVAGAPIPA